ncbi:Flp pilus assembly protein CpaB [Rhizobium sp. KVB221]|uniref:Flp pilus assembly protein CpaB n=1 Tax=Rhizobium setariae TaxID=2801340 RepID=A0A936YQK8_9HYPH|nr:Flp pilus assembly protein CpaB [Rhizobium setariae]MBL0372716.1 Flp pilus assembly protein CpaB [Rhizobium setariae]
MKPARLIILSVALVAAGAAAFLAMKLTGKQTVVQLQAETVVHKEPVIKVLVAAANLPVGSRLTEDAMHWAGWPEGSLVEGFITEQNRPDALTELKNAIVRMPVFEGEPLRAEKIADPGNAIMSSILPSGKRAVGTEISVSTSAGGFILPNDRVDVIMVRKEEGGSGYTTETILTNIRVLAIDQEIQEKEEGAKSVVGTTATLELNPDQARVITVAQQMAERLTLALRSVADAQEPDSLVAKHLLSGDSGTPTIQVIKSGVIQQLNDTASKADENN